MSLIVPGFSSPDTLTDVRTATIDNTWTTQSVSTSNWEYIAWSPTLSLLVATSSTNDRMARSSNGSSWTTFTVTSIDAGWNGIVWNPTSEKFLAISSNGNESATSADGTSWVTSTVTGTAPGTNVIWNSSLGIYAGVGGGVNSGDFTSSIDGITWTSVDSLIATTSGIVWSDELSLYVISGQTAGFVGAFSSSSDGLSWTSTSTAGVTQIYKNVAWSPILTRFVAVSDGVGRIATSSNGTSWATYSETGDFTNIVWSPRVELFVAVGITSPSNKYSSTGLTGTWTTVSGLGTQNYNSVTWSPGLQNFYIAGDSNILAKSASDYSSLVQSSTNGTQGVTDYTIKGQDVSVGTSANLVTIGKYASQITLGSPGVPVSIPGTFMGYSYIADEKTAGTSGGTFSNGAWRTRDLTAITNYGNIDCTLDSNQFTLGPGTYGISANAPMYQVNRNAARLRRITAPSTTILFSSSNYNTNTTQVVLEVFIRGFFTITESVSFEIQHSAQDTRTNGFGFATGIQTEVYTQVSLYRLF